jgi:hypothetical protein
VEVIGLSSSFMPGLYHWVSNHAILVDGEDLDEAAPDFAMLLEEAIVTLPVEKLVDKLRAVFQLDVDALAFYWWRCEGFARGSSSIGLERNFVQ